MLSMTSARTICCLGQELRNGGKRRGASFLRTRHAWWGCLLIVSACRAPLTESECAQLLDHYTERVIEQSRPSAKPAERAKLVGEARLKAARDPEFAACSAKVERHQFECALASHNADEIERCLL